MSQPTADDFWQLRKAYAATCDTAAAMALTLDEVAHVVAEYDPVMEGPAAAVASMTRIVEILAESELGPKVVG